MPPDIDVPIDDPRLEGGEWLFRRGDQVFGPVPSRGIAQLLYRGEIEAQTLVSSGGGDWRPVGEVPPFVLHAKKAAAALHVEREVTSARQIQVTRGRRRSAALVVALLVLVAGAGAGGFWLAHRRPPTSPLLEDFGAGIGIASAARVGISSRSTAAEDEVEVPLDREAPPGARRERPARAAGLGAAARAPSGAVEDGVVAAAQFDERKIQSVVAREQRTLVPCFREESTRSPEFSGDVPIEFAIANDGRVAALWIDEPRLRNGPLRDCLQRALAGWHFEPFPGQRPTVSLAFRIGK
jgi:hypothetical protein